MDAPRVTVAVPALNQGRFIDQALESIFAQHLPVEVFVADGGSTDGTVEAIRRWEPRLSGWRSQPDAGQSAAINEAIARGTAPYVCWLNSDDWWLPGSLAKLVAALENDAVVKDTDVAGPGFVNLRLHPSAIHAELEHWHFDTFRTRSLNAPPEAPAEAGRLMVTFALDATGDPRTLTLGALGEFRRRAAAGRGGRGGN